MEDKTYWRGIVEQFGNDAALEMAISEIARLRRALRAMVGVSESAGRRYILNSAVITAPGVYEYQVTTVERAREWARQGPFVSTIGYQETAAFASELLGVGVPMNRRTITMAPGDEALVVRIVLPPGSPRIDPADKGRLGELILDGHFELGLLCRIA